MAYNATVQFTLQSTVYIAVVNIIIIIEECDSCENLTHVGSFVVCSP